METKEMESSGRVFNGTSKSKWSQQEDKELLDAIRATYNGDLPPTGEISWRKVKKRMPTRSPLQIRERYAYILNPHLRCKKLSKEEVVSLLQFHREFGNKWTKIAVFFNCVLRRFEREYKRPPNNDELIRFYCEIEDISALKRSSSEVSDPMNFSQSTSAEKPFSPPRKSQKQNSVASVAPEISHQPMREDDVAVNLNLSDFTSPEHIHQSMQEDGVAVNPDVSALTNADIPVLETDPEFNWNQGSPISFSPISDLSEFS